MSTHSTDSGSGENRPLRLMLASTVYGFETELEQIAAVLRAYGYEIWNSHLGTIRAHPDKSNLENCLIAVQECDVFLGIIWPFYGSGKVGQRSITHEEMLKAVELVKPRWFLVHDHVTFARQLLRPFFVTKTGKRKKRPPKFQKTAVMDDLRVLQMYDDVIQNQIPAADRKGHWAQQFFHLNEALRYIEANLRDIEVVRRICEEMKIR
ncbi:MAG: DUF4062 domain-containing protein [Planctomycetaceae bacterium]